jgi:hypothetical protein
VHLNNEIRRECDGFYEESKHPKKLNITIQRMDDIANEPEVVEPLTERLTMTEVMGFRVDEPPSHSDMEAILGKKHRKESKHGLN